MATYFDLTDLVQYATGHNRVSGIQRVQWRVLSEVARREQTDHLRVCFYSNSRKSFVSVGLNALFDGVPTEFHAERMLRALGKIKPARLPLPMRHEVKALLKQQNHSKWMRALSKGHIYLTALLKPQTLLDRGMTEWRASKRLQVEPIPSQALALKSTDQLVLLGSFWDQAQVLKLARQHRQAQGNVTMLVHDVIPLAAPDLCSASQVKRFREVMHQIPHLANRFLAVSQFSACDFVRAMDGHVSHNDVRITPLAHEFRHVPRTIPQAPQQGDTNTGHHRVLCVGTIESRKNPLLLPQVWQALIAQQELAIAQAPLRSWANVASAMLEAIGEPVTSKRRAPRAWPDMNPATRRQIAPQDWQNPWDVASNHNTA